MGFTADHSAPANDNTALTMVSCVPPNKLHTTWWKGGRRRSRHFAERGGGAFFRDGDGSLLEDSDDVGVRMPRERQHCGFMQVGGHAFLYWFPQLEYAIQQSLVNGRSKYSWCLRSGPLRKGHHGIPCDSLKEHRSCCCRKSVGGYTPSMKGKQSIPLPPSDGP